MQKFFKISALILLLGLFLIPKSISAAPILEDTCCTSSDSNCCKKESTHKEKPCHSKDKKDGNKDCHDCHSCSSIGFFANILQENLVEKDFINFKSQQKTSFYLAPEFSNHTSKIWQPPKIV